MDSNKLSLRILKYCSICLIFSKLVFAEVGDYTIPTCRHTPIVEKDALILTGDINTANSSLEERNFVFFQYNDPNTDTFRSICSINLFPTTCSPNLIPDTCYCKENNSSFVTVVMNVTAKFKFSEKEIRLIWPMETGDDDIIVMKAEAPEICLGPGKRCTSNNECTGFKYTGQCTTAGVCECAHLYTLSGEDCVYSPGKRCTSNNECTGFKYTGECTTTGVCECAYLYMISGEDCVYFPGKRCTLDNECAGFQFTGNCSGSGICECAYLYEKFGDDCESSAASIRCVFVVVAASLLSLFM